MRIRVQRETYLRVSKRVHDRPGINALCKQECCCRVPYVVKANIRDTRFFQHALEVLRETRRARRGGPSPTSAGRADRGFAA